LMENASDENNIKLMAFQDIGSNKHIYFFIALIVYLLIILFNCSVIFTILLDKGLHEPMYIFLCNLLLSELVGSSSFYIKFLFDIQTDMLVISRPACFIQSFFISLYVSVEISVLMVMAHDRYIAINFPLHYFCLISTRKVQIFIFVAWMYSVLVVTTSTSLTACLPLCGNIINNLYCSNWEFLKLSCKYTNASNIFGYLVMCSFCVPFIFILYSYIKILKVCLNSSRSHKFKALQTCMPHLVTLLLFATSLQYEVMESKLNLKRQVNAITLFTSLEYLTVPPLLNPLTYGIILPGIRKRIYMYYFLALIVYILIILFNCSIIIVIFLDKGLHEPMYIFLCNLLLSELVGSSSFYIKFLFDIQTDIQVISLPACFIQISIISLYISVEISILMVMAHDRYIAINFPLHYISLISTRKVQFFIFVAWMYSLFVVTTSTSLTACLPLCGKQIRSLYCSNWEFVKLSCKNTNNNNIFGYLVMCLFFIPFIFILYSYIKILRVCWNRSKSHKFKAFQTCVPHLVTLLLFATSLQYEIMDSKLNLKREVNAITLFASLEFLTVPPLLNPLIYGIILPGIRKRFIYIISSKIK
ncbi:O51G2 protein, partial [Polypterus senegalus]|nr:O51G2 protein [Polypterus senegalus]